MIQRKCDSYSLCAEIEMVLIVGLTLFVCCIVLYVASCFVLCFCAADPSMLVFTGGMSRRRAFSGSERCRHGLRYEQRMRSSPRVGEGLVYLRLGLVRVKVKDRGC